MVERLTERPSDRELIEALISVPGSTGESYRRFWNYSTRNLGMLALQACPPLPVATYKRWSDLGFHVKKGEKAYSILRPINVKIEAPEDSERDFILVQRFKVVKALFHYAQVAGEAELPPYVPPEWNTERALKTLNITEVPFESYNGNLGGYSIGRTIAVSPVSPNPFRTTLHETAHVDLGHTTDDTMAEYQAHRGTFEAEAETTAHLVYQEVGDLDEATANVSRGYIQAWLGDDTLKDGSIRKIMTSSTRIIAAGYEPSSQSNPADV